MMPPDPVAGAEYVAGMSLSPDADWRAALRGVGVVVHTAARVHIMRDAASTSLDQFRQVNVAGTLNLARQAAEVGVRRFVFVSSIKVNGEQTTPGCPYTALDCANPIDPYGISKFEAEVGLRELAQRTGIEMTVVRPVLVYGPGVKANFARMLSWVQREVPLPFGAIHNKRSLLGLANLVDLLLCCATHSGASGRTFLASDGEDVSTTELLKRMASALRVRSRLIPVPERLLSLSARLAGRVDLARRLLGSLQVDIDDTKAALGWEPPTSLDQGLREIALPTQRLNGGL